MRKVLDWGKSRWARKKLKGTSGHHSGNREATGSGQMSLSVPFHAAVSSIQPLLVVVPHQPNLVTKCGNVSPKASNKIQDLLPVSTQDSRELSWRSGWHLALQSGNRDTWLCSWHQYHSLVNFHHYLGHHQLYNHHQFQQHHQQQHPQQHKHNFHNPALLHLEVYM